MSNIGYVGLKFRKYICVGDRDLKELEIIESTCLLVNNMEGRDCRDRRRNLEYIVIYRMDG